MLQHFQGKLCGKLCNFYKADLTLFYQASEGETHFLLSNRQLEHKRTLKAPKISQLLPHFNYFNLKWLIQSIKCRCYERNYLLQAMIELVLRRTYIENIEQSIPTTVNGPLTQKIVYSLPMSNCLPLRTSTRSPRCRTTHRAPV